MDRMATNQEEKQEQYLVFYNNPVKYKRINMHNTQENSEI